MEEKKGSLPHKQFASFTNMGRNRPNDAMKGVENSKQNFYFKQSE